MTKQQSSAILHKIYRHLDSRELSLKLDSNIHSLGMLGASKEGYDTLTVDPRAGGLKNLISTALHELLHWVYEEKSETEIAKLERQMFKQLSDRQLANFLKRIVEKL